MEREQSAPRSETFAVSGLQNPARILVDPYGVPHIYASSRLDAFFAQGFNAARDRLWQIDLWRRSGLGRLAEVLGPSFVERDKAARLFLYRGELNREWPAYGLDTEAVAGTFVAGVNAYVRLTEESLKMLPAEFQELGYRPAYWQPEDVVRIRIHGLSHNVEEQVSRAAALRDFGPGVEAVRRRLEPPQELSGPRPEPRKRWWKR